MCPECRKKSQQRHDQQSSQRRARYGPEYEKFREYLKTCGNLFCQHVDELGYRCTAPAEITHHLLSAEEFPKFKCDYRNAVRVCRAHHENTPSDSGRARYIPTRFKFPMQPATPTIDCAPGDRLAAPDYERLWTLATQRRLLFG
jgi:hypothetical protein